MIMNRTWRVHYATLHTAPLPGGCAVVAESVTIPGKADQQALAEMLRLERLLKHSISV